MADYTKITDFAVKDSLLTGNPLKLITGTAHDNEYNAISVAIATKVDESGGTLTNGTLVNPALGTPASGTLTNCIGLPLAGVTDSTTEALGVGSLELGHASDTTLTRVSAGVMAIEGVNVLTTATGAALAGSATQTFSVDAASSAAHAVRYDQFNSKIASSSFTGTFTGFSVATTSTIYYTNIGNFVHMTGGLVSVSGTSNATTKTMTGIPASLIPTRNQYLICIASDNGGAFVIAQCEIKTDGSINFTTSPSGAAWTASGIATIVLSELTYLLN